MKKFFLIAAVAGSLIACNNAADSTAETKDSLDSIANETKDALDSSTEAKKDAIDSTTEQKKDLVDSLHTGADSAAH